MLASFAKAGRTLLNRAYAAITTAHSHWRVGLLAVALCMSWLFQPHNVISIQSLL
jgi:hypothetical protein